MLESQILNPETHNPPNVELYSKVENITNLCPPYWVLVPHPNLASHPGKLGVAIYELEGFLLFLPRGSIVR